MGFFVAVDALGFDPSMVAAGLGPTGIVLDFALKNILSNFVSGLLLDQPAIDRSLTPISPCSLVTA